MMRQKDLFLFFHSFFCFGCNLLVKFRSQMAGDYLPMGVSRSDAAIAIYSIENIWRNLGQECVSLFTVV
jgi:hypothetical protein